MVSLLIAIQATLASFAPSAHAYLTPSDVFGLPDEPAATASGSSSLSSSEDYTWELPPVALPLHTEPAQESGKRVFYRNGETLPAPVAPQEPTEKPVPSSSSASSAGSSSVAEDSSLALPATVQRPAAPLSLNTGVVIAIVALPAFFIMTVLGLLFLRGGASRSLPPSA